MRSKVTDTSDLLIEFATLRTFTFYTNIADPGVEHGIYADLGKEQNHSSLSLEILMNSVSLGLVHVIDGLSFESVL